MLRIPCSALARLAGLALALIVPALHGAYTWSASGMVGSGTQSVVAVHPTNSAWVISGGDVAGFHVSEDYGATWKTYNRGLDLFNPPKVASIVFSNNPSTPDTVYAGIGDEGADGGFVVSTNAGKDWDMLSTTPQFSGNGESSAHPTLPGRWPRSTGNLIAVDETGGTKYLYAGTFKDGLMRSTDGGATWTTVGLVGYYIRGIILDPNNANTMYVATYDHGVRKCTDVRTRTGTTTSGWPKTDAPDDIEELLILGTTIYAAGSDAGPGSNTGGVWKSTDGGTTFSALPGVDSAAVWTAITGYVDTGGAHVLFIGASDPVKQSGDANYRTIRKSANGGSTWTPLTLAANIVNQIGGAGGPAWWMNEADAGPYYMLGRGSCDISSLYVRANASYRVYMTGRGGVWRTTTANASPSSSTKWYPMMNGLSVSACFVVATDPNNASRVYWGNLDWTFFYSNDGGATVRRNCPVVSPGPGSGCRAIAVDPYDSKVFIGTLDDAAALQSDGSILKFSVYSNSNPTTSTSWTDEGLAAATGYTVSADLDNNGVNENYTVPRKVRGVGVGRDASSQRVILGAVDVTGIWRKVGSGSWTNVTSAFKPHNAVTLSFAWKKNSAYVFAYEHETGLWRSADYGATWTLIWNGLSDGSGSNTGWVVHDPSVEGRLYVSTSNGVFRFLDARTGTGLTQTNMGGPVNPGPIAYANGKLYACDFITTSRPAKIFRWNTPGTSTTNAEIGNAAYSGQAGWPAGLDVGPDDRVYTSQTKNGMMIGTEP